MITFPCCKINLGLNVVSKREDGFHDIETVFYPIPLCDVLEVKKMNKDFPSDMDCDLKITGHALECDERDNLVVKAYELMAKDYKLPRIHIHLYKKIPSKAGLGGGSSDAAYMIRLLDERFRVRMGITEMERYASMLGADCTFFITSTPSYATGKGDIITPVDNEMGSLNGYYVTIVKPDISVSTAEAYADITPQKPVKCCRDIVKQPIETWKDELHNDFEPVVFAKYPELATIKQKLYDNGALYAQMSGSGSALYGIFKKEPIGIKANFPDMFCETIKI